MTARTGTHQVLTIDRAGPLHPTEVALVAAALSRGHLVRRCSCGYLLVGGNRFALGRSYYDHLRG